MERCRICGEPSGIYEVCRSCQSKIDSGEVKKCLNCGEYYLATKECKCAIKEEPEVHTTEKTTIINNSIPQQNNESSAFSKGCGTTFGAGCGCVAFIVVAIIIVVITLLTLSN